MLVRTVPKPTGVAGIHSLRGSEVNLTFKVRTIILIDFTYVNDHMPILGMLISEPQYKRLEGLLVVLCKHFDVDISNVEEVSPTLENPPSKQPSPARSIPSATSSVAHRFSTVTVAGPSGKSASAKSASIKSSVKSGISGASGKFTSYTMSPQLLTTFYR